MASPTVQDLVFDFWRALLETDPDRADRCITTLAKWVLPEVGHVAVDDLRVSLAVSLAHTLETSAPTEDAVDALAWLRQVFLFGGVLLRCECCGGAAFENHQDVIRCARCHTAAA